VCPYPRVRRNRCHFIDITCHKWHLIATDNRWMKLATVNVRHLIGALDGWIPGFNDGPGTVIIAPAIAISSRPRLLNRIRADSTRAKASEPSSRDPSARDRRSRIAPLTEVAGPLLAISQARSAPTPLVPRVVGAGFRRSPAYAVKTWDPTRRARQIGDGRSPSPAHPSIICAIKMPFRQLMSMNGNGFSNSWVGHTARRVDASWPGRTRRQRCAGSSAAGPLPGG